jgi:hypothetical protein
VGPFEPASVNSSRAKTCAGSLPTGRRSSSSASTTDWRRRCRAHTNAGTRPCSTTAVGNGPAWRGLADVLSEHHGRVNARAGDQHAASKTMDAR